MSEPARQARGDSGRTPGGQVEDDARALEAASILKRVREETEPQIGAGAARMVTDAKAHFSARDADAGDPLEVMGTRIGRGLALVVFAVLLVSLVLHFLRG